MTSPSAVPSVDAIPVVKVSENREKFCRCIVQPPPYATKMCCSLILSLQDKQFCSRPGKSRAETRKNSRKF